MRNLLKSLIIVPAIMVAQPLPAAEAKIGFVNQGASCANPRQPSARKPSSTKEFAARRAELIAWKTGPRTRSHVAKESVTLPEAERAAKERQLQQLTRDFQRLQREFREDVNLRRNEELVTLQERANKVINEIAEKESSI